MAVQQAACSVFFHVSVPYEIHHLLFSILSVQHSHLRRYIALIEVMEPKEGFDCAGYAAYDFSGHLSPFKFKRRYAYSVPLLIALFHGFAGVPLDSYLQALKQKSVLVMVGGAGKLEFAAHNVFQRKVITGSAAGGMQEIQDMLNFCGEKGVTPMIETINIDYVNEAIERLLKNDVRYRFVVDIEKSLEAPE